MSITTTERTEPFELSGWDLSELLPEPTEEVIQERLAALEERVQAFTAWREKLSPEMDPADLVALLRQYEELVAQSYVLGAYGSLWFSADTQSSAALTYRNRIQQVLTGVQNRTLFFELWWKSLDDDEAAALLPSPEQYPDYRHHLEDLRRTKPYTLDERSEQIINIKDANGIDAVITLYSMLTNRLEFTITVDGETKTLTRDGLMAYAQSARADLRAAAYQELYRVYGNESNILAQIYANRVRDWYAEHVELRGYPSPIAVRNVANDIPDAAVDALLDVCRQNAGVFQRYFRLKAGWLGMEKLRRYDIYAPLQEDDREIPYQEAVSLVLDTFQRFEPQVARLARRVFEEKHIDSEVRKGKRGGAFCATVLPSQTPWVLMNYTGKVRDVATLAHELGHAIHSMMAADHSVLTQHATLPLAETASVFAEMLLTERLLTEEQDPLVRRNILVKSLDDMYATVLRQAYFVLFEREAHAAIMDNKSPEDLYAMYMANLAEQFGDSVEVSDEFRYEWVSIPHIYHTPFYCYAYSFGQLLVLALYRRYQQEGEAFKPGYLRMLARGGSARPEEILQEAGIDMTDPAFWQGGFDVIRDLIDQLEGIKL
ncbi:M3 family oligoendopeptidase [Litorilinea aerophila]|uniref:M3 family oligoendopeptidase n=1 Tax=Litorilinea aerophila TaxID=1204385 RepID=UPI000B73A24C|nr:M3 family oligoendopeptidase [Litorilinea aerophila]MCC9076364.1 M3 family oligoendopeptidase [Litorilinea aerophila]OUC06096.1 oligoendopeptidase F [Litorilinea aerophila]